MLCETHERFTAPILPPLTDFKALHGVYAAADYHQVNTRALVRFLKFHRHRYTAQVMARVLLEALPPHVWENSVVVPLPLHWTRRWTRGFNQSDILAQTLVEVYPGLQLCTQLKRTRWTRQQARLSRRQRLNNMTGAFAWEGKKPPKRVILLDDVCTTGSTLQAAAQALKKAGAKQVVGVVFAYQSLQH